MTLRRVAALASAALVAGCSVFGGRAALEPSRGRVGKGACA